VTKQRLKDNIIKMHSIFNKLDEDGSNSVDQQEFMKLFNFRDKGTSEIFF